MKKRFYQLGKQVLSLSAIVASILLFSNQVSAQGVSINGTNPATAPDASAILDLNVSGLGANAKKGFLFPRVALTGTTDAATIPSPATSLTVYNTATGGGVSPGFYYNSGTPGAPAWVSIGGSGSAPTEGNDINVSGTQVDVEPILNYVNTIYPTLGTGGISSSDLTLNAPLFNNIIFQANSSEVARVASTGNFGIGDPSPAALFTVGNGDKFQVDANGNLIEINDLGGYSWPTAHATGVLRNNGTGTLTWGAPTISGAAALTTNNIWIGVGNIATERTMSGDATLTDNGSNAVLDLTALAVETSEINTNAVTDAKIRQSAGLSVIGRSANSTGDVADITAGTDGHVLRRNGTALGFGTIGGASFGPQTANTVFAGPTTGGAANPTFRAMVPADLAASGANGEVLGITGGALDWVATMTNPMTTTGDIIYGSTTATPSAPARVGAGTAGMVLHTNGTSGAPTWSKVNLASGSEVTGTTNNTILIGNASGSVSSLAGTNMQTLRFNATPAPVASSNLLNNDITIGIGGLTTGEVGSSTAKLDVDGDGALGTIALQLRAGNSATDLDDAVQIAFGWNGSDTYRHSIRTNHNSGGNPNNSLTFYVWDPTVDLTTAIGSKKVIEMDYLKFGFWGKLQAQGTLGTNGQILISDASGVPTWQNPSGLGITTSVTAPIVNTGTGTAPVIGIRGTSGGILYGLGAGTSADFSAAGTSGQILLSGGTGAPTWSSVAALMADLTASNGLTLSANYDGSSTQDVKLGGALTANTTITQDNAEVLTFTNGGSGGTIVNLTSTGDFIVQDAGSTALIVNDDGNVGVGGASNASYKFTVTGKVKSTGINETSDARLKMNFASIDGALNKVLSMNGKYYNWRTQEFPDKGLEDGRQVGVIAQEMEAILPEVVTTGDDGYKAVEYGHIVPVLIEAIKEQQKIIDSQNSTITDLKASLENVLNRVNIIEKNADIISSKVER